MDHLRDVRGGQLLDPLIRTCNGVNFDLLRHLQLVLSEQSLHVQVCLPDEFGRRDQTLPRVGNWGAC